MTAYEELIHGEQNGAHTIEIREKDEYRHVPLKGVANSTPRGTIQCYIGSDNGSDDCEITPDEFSHRFVVTAVLYGKQEDALLSEKTKKFDLPAYILGEVYGPIYIEGEPLNWTFSDSEALAIDLKNEFGIVADPKEIFDLMMEFYHQDEG